MQKTNTQKSRDTVPLHYDSFSYYRPDSVLYHGLSEIRRGPQCGPHRVPDQPSALSQVPTPFTPSRTFRPFVFFGQKNCSSGYREYMPIKHSHLKQSGSNRTALKQFM